MQRGDGGVSEFEFGGGSYERFWEKGGRDAGCCESKLTMSNFPGRSDHWTVFW